MRVEDFIHLSSSTVRRRRRQRLSCIISRLVMSSSGSHVETVSTIVEVEGLNIGGMGRGLKVQTIKLKF